MNPYDEIPADSRAMLDSAVRMLNLHQIRAEDMVLMVYNLGRIDGGMSQLDRDHDAVIERLMPENLQ